MRITLLESDRSFMRSAEYASLSIMAHIGLVWLAFGMTSGGLRIPTDEREARVFFLLPPDRVDAPQRQTAVIQWGRLGGELAGGADLAGASAGRSFGGAAEGARRYGERSRERGRSRSVRRRRCGRIPPSACCRWTRWWSATTGVPRRSTRMI